ncbi:MAG: sensor histidine kinase [Gammaproteobacteria bacterium]
MTLRLPVIGPFKLQTRMLLILGLLALLQTGLMGGFTLHLVSTTLEEQIGQRALQVAKTVADIPQIQEAVEARNSDLLQPLSLTIAHNIGARFVVIGDNKGIRLTHPIPERIGKPMVGGDNPAALELGLSYVSKAKGSLGWSMRGKAAIFDTTGERIIGVVSVGYMLDRVEAIIAGYQNKVLLVIAGALLLSLLAGGWFTRHFKKAIFGLEPEEIARLFEERNATLEAVREGIIAVDVEGRILTFNRAAIETLALRPQTPLTGQYIRSVLPESQIMEVLRTGRMQLDQEVWLNNQCLIVNRIPLQLHGRIIGAVSSFRRKDELDRISQRLSRIEEYAETLRSQSHEYSNKLHTIAGLIQIGANDKALELIGQETEGHQTLIQLLVDAVPDPVLAGCLLGKYNRAREMGLGLLIDPESQMADLPERLPREQLVSIVGNLLDNAMEATLKARGPGGKIRLTMTDLGKDLIFEIEDQGPGITPDEQSRIFEKGVSSKPLPGHGIGLHLVRTLLDQMGGSIEIEPLDPDGSRVTVYIPKTAVNERSSGALH